MALSKGSWSPTSGMRENWLVQIHETDGSGFKAFSFFDQTVNSVAYSGIITNSPNIRESINVFKSTFKVSNLSIKLHDNSNLRQDLLFGSNYYLNGEVKIFSNLQSGSPANFDNIPQIYQGRLESISHSDNSIVLGIVAKRPYDNVVVPNVYSNEYIPAPLAYGDYSGHSNIKTNSTPNNWRAIPFTKYDSNGLSFVSGTLSETSEEVAAYVPSYDLFVKYQGGTYNNSTVGSVKVFQIPSGAYHVYQVAPISNSTVTSSSEITTANLSNCYDNDDATEGTFTWPIGSVIAGTHTHKERFTLDTAIMENSEGRVYYDVTGVNNVDEIRVQVLLLDEDNNNVGTGIEKIHVSNASNQTAKVVSSGNANRIDLQIEIDYSSGATPGATIEVKEVFAYQKRYQEEVEFAYVAADGEQKGYKGSTARVTKIHEAHRSFVHNVLGVDTDGAGSSDPDGWSDLDSDRGSWTCRYNLLQLTDAKKVLDQLQFEGGFITTFAADGDVKYIHVKDSYSSADHSIDKNDIGNITFSHTPIKNIITDILVNYDPHPAKDRVYRNQATASESTIRSNYNISTAKVVTYNLDALIGGIGSDLTPSSANAGFINYYGNLRSEPRIIMTTTIVNPSLFSMELGDICTFSNMLPSTAFNKSFSGLYFMVTSISRGSGIMSVQFTEVS